MAIVVGLSGMGRLWTRHFEMLGRLDEDVNLIERVKMWRGAVLSVRDRPVLGIGPRNFRNLDHERYGFQRTDVYGRRWTDAHNLFLTVLAERGLLGFLSLIGFLVCYVYECIRRRPAKDALSQALWHAAMGSFITIVVAGMVNTTLHAEGGAADPAAAPGRGWRPDRRADHLRERRIGSAGLPCAGRPCPEKCAGSGNHGGASQRPEVGSPRPSSRGTAPGRGPYRRRRQGWRLPPVVGTVPSGRS